MGWKVRAARSAAAAVVAAVGAVALAGCSMEAEAGSEAPATGRIVAALVDQSCDATEDLTALAGPAVDASVRAAAADGGTFLGEAITTDEYQSGTFNISAEFSSDAANDTSRQIDLDAQAEDFLAGKDGETLRAGPATGDKCGSDLVNAMSAAGRTFSQVGDSGAREKDLVFITNGLLIDGARNFVWDTMTPEYLEQVIDEQQAADLFPDLTGVNVHFVGIGISDQPATAEQIRTVERFWESYATRAGAKSVELVGRGSGVILGGQA